MFLGDLGHPLTEAELAPSAAPRSCWPPPAARRRSTFPRSSALLDAIGPRIVIPDAFQDAQDQPQHPAAGAISGSPARRSDRRGPARARSRSRAAAPRPPHDRGARARAMIVRQPARSETALAAIVPHSSRSAEITSSRTARRAGSMPPKSPMARVMSSATAMHQRSKPERDGHRGEAVEVAGFVGQAH